MCCGLALFSISRYHFSTRKTVFPHANYHFSIPYDQVPFFFLTLRNYFVVVFAAVAAVVAVLEEGKRKDFPIPLFPPFFYFPFGAFSPFGFPQDSFPPEMVFPFWEFPLLVESRSNGLRPKEIFPFCKQPCLVGRGRPHFEESRQ